MFGGCILLAIAMFRCLNVPVNPIPDPSFSTPPCPPHSGPLLLTPSAYRILAIAYCLLLIAPEMGLTGTEGTIQRSRCVTNFLLMHYWNCSCNGLVLLPRTIRTDLRNQSKCWCWCATDELQSCRICDARNSCISLKRSFVHPGRQMQSSSTAIKAEGNRQWAASDRQKASGNGQ